MKSIALALFALTLSTIPAHAEIDDCATAAPADLYRKAKTMSAAELRDEAYLCLGQAQGLILAAKSLPDTKDANPLFDKSKDASNAAGLLHALSKAK
jgi:hypothetical protein